MMAVTACGEDPTIVARLGRAESSMEEHPDSALAILQSIDASALRTEKHSAHYALLYSQALDKNYIDITNDSLISIAVDYYSDSDDELGLIKSLFYHARIYYNKQEYANAIKQAIKANELALRTNDYFWQAKTTEIISDIHSVSHMSIEATKYSLKTSELYKKANKTRNHLFALCDVAIGYGNIGNYTQSIHLLDSINHIAHSTPSDSLLVAYCYRALAYTYFYSKSYHKADSCFNSIVRFAPNYHFSSNDYTHKTLIDFHLKDGNISIQPLQQAQTLSSNLTDKSAVQYAYALYYRNKHMYKKALEHADSAFLLQNNEVKNTLKQSIVVSQRDFFKEQASDEIIRSSRLKQYLLIGFIGFCVIFVISITFYRLKLRLKEMSLNNKMSDIIILSEQINRQNVENKLLSLTISQKEDIISSLNTTIDTLNNKITSLNQEATRTSVSMNNTINNTIETLFKDKWKILNSLCNEFFEKGNSATTKAFILRNIELEIDKLRSQKSIKNIEDAANKYMNEIINKLRVECPFLKQDDIIFLTLIYAGFSPRAVCLFTDIKLKYFYNKKARIAERITNSNAPNKELFISKL